MRGARMQSTAARGAPAGQRGGTGDTTQPMRTRRRAAHRSRGTPAPPIGGIKSKRFAPTSGTERPPAHARIEPQTYAGTLLRHGQHTNRRWTMGTGMHDQFRGGGAQRTLRHRNQIPTTIHDRMNQYARWSGAQMAKMPPASMNGGMRRISERMPNQAFLPFGQREHLKEGLPV